MRGTAKAPSARSTTATFTELRKRFGIAAALLAVIALVLPAFASADPLGSATFYNSGLRSTAQVTTLTPGPDGNVWFIDNKFLSGGSGSGIQAIGRITPSGEIKEYVSGTSLSGLNAGSDPTAIVAGPGGSKYLWFTDRNESPPAIGVIDSTSPGTATEFSIEEKGGKAGSVPEGITVGPDGNLWFTDISESTPAIGKIELSAANEIKKIEEFPLASGGKPLGIVAGSDGNLWFTNPRESAPGIGRINPSTHVIKEFPTGENSEPGGLSATSGPWGIVAGPDGNVWFTDSGSSKHGKAVCRIATSGENEITCSNKGLIPSSIPTGLTTAGGKLWFTDNSGVNEEQELVIEDSGTLGGTYKLGFEGQETGATGTGNLLTKAGGKGDVKRWPATGNATCKRLSGSKELTECNSEPSVKAEVGMRITGTGIPAETLITKIEGTTVFISNAVTGFLTVRTSTTNINAGRVINVETTSGKFENGQVVTGIGIPASSSIFNLEEKEGKASFALTNTPESGKAALGVTLTVNSTTVVTGVKATTGTFTKGEAISGAGIPAGSTISATNPNTKSLTLSTTPEAAGTEVALSADLPFNAGFEAVRDALRAFSTIGSSGVSVSGTGTIPPINRTISFENARAHADVELLSCNGAGLTGTSPTCSVTEKTKGLPNAIGCMTTSGEVCGKETRWPLAQLFAGGGDIKFGADGNLWLGTGFSSSQKIGKFGIETAQLTVSKTGSGTGTVTSSPEGINCGSECSAEFPKGTEVTLTATASEGSVFEGWSGSGCSGTGTCKVTMSEAKAVTAEFAKTSNRRTLTLTKSAGGTGGIGTVSSKPKGIKCGGACNKAVASLYKNSTVLLTAKPATGSTFTEWTGACSGAGTCEVTMTAAKSVGAVFGPTSKAIAEPTALTVSKGESTGHGYVKASGLACEGDCTETTVLYQGPITLPKPKPAKTVELSQTPSFGSEFSGWSGCDEVKEGKCIVTMSAAKAVTATYAAKPNVTLTVTKNTAEGNYSSGTGTVTSKPKAIKCATTCITQSAAIPQGESIILTAKPATGMTFVEFEGGGCGVSPSCEVTMSSSKTVTAKFTGSPKLIANEQKLTLNKAGSGFGTVKASGLACEALCTTATSLYTGGVELPKPKPAATVTLEGIPAPGSKAVAWTGCDSETEGKCVVSTTAAKAVTATFNELE